MPNYDGNLASSAKANPAVPKAAIVSNVVEETGTAAEDKRPEASPDEIDAKAASGSPADDDVEYVHGHPVIRNGTCLLRVDRVTMCSLLTRLRRHGRVQVRRVGSR